VLFSSGFLPVGRYYMQKEKYLPNIGAFFQKMCYDTYQHIPITEEKPCQI
jgi:hypothetical protein